MRNSWTRAWLAAVGLLVAAGAIARNRDDLLLKVEQPVMDWLLDGTDTSIWDNAAIFSATWLLVGGTIVLTSIAFFLERRVAAAIPLTMLLGFAVSRLASGAVNRSAPSDAFEAGTFPSTEVVMTGVFWGLVVLMCWWIGAPKLVWQIVLELAIVATLIVSIRLIVSGAIWPSDAVGSAIAVAVTLIAAAAVLELTPPKLPVRERTLAT